MFMPIAQAQLAMEANEVPVGCVFVKPPEADRKAQQESDWDTSIIAVGHNKTNATRNATRHAELVAIDTALLPREQGDAAGDASVFRGCEL